MSWFDFISLSSLSLIPNLFVFVFVFIPPHHLINCQQGHKWVRQHCSALMTLKSKVSKSVIMSLIELSCTAKNSNNANKATDKKILPELGSPPQPGAPAGMVPGWDKLYQYICTYKYIYVIYVDILWHIPTHMFYDHWFSSATCALTTATSSSSMRPTLRRRPL